MKKIGSVLKSGLCILALTTGLAVIAPPIVGLAEDYHYKTAAFLLRAKQTHVLIRPVPIMFEVDTELEALLRVYRYLNKRFKYVSDDENHYWTSSDTMFERMAGDCEDWAMLFVAMVRFSTTKPIPADRIWVTLSYDAVFGYHAWVMYRTRYGQPYSFDLTHGIYGYRGLQVRPKHIWLMFNDKDVVGL